MFDLGAAAMIFSRALAFTPKGLPHHEVFVRAGVWSLAATLAIAVFAGVVRVAGGAVAGFARGRLGLVSKPAGESIATKIVGFRDGLNALSSARDFAVVTLLSLAMWGMIGSAYVQTAHAFVRTPELAGADVFANDAADGGEYWRVSAAASDRWLVYADCGYGGGDACVLWRAD